MYSRGVVRSGSEEAQETEREYVPEVAWGGVSTRRVRGSTVCAEREERGGETESALAAPTVTVHDEGSVAKPGGGS